MPEVPNRHREREMSRQRAFRQRFERALASKVGERAVGKPRAIANTHLGMLAKERAQRRVGRHVETRNALDRGGECRELVAAQRHWPRKSSARIGGIIGLPGMP